MTPSPYNSVLIVLHVPHFVTHQLFLEKVFAHTFIKWHVFMQETVAVV